MSKPPYEFRGNAYRSLLELEPWIAARPELILEPELPIIDPHHHVWDGERGRYLVHELAADVNTGHNIVATVFIEAGSMYRARGPGDATGRRGRVRQRHRRDECQRTLRASRTCAGIIGHADLTLGDGAKPVLEALIAAGNGRFRGIRHGVTWDTGHAAKFGRRQVPQHQVLDPVFRQGFAHLDPLGLSFEFVAVPPATA